MEKEHILFGQRLRELREEAGLSMLQLAKAVGVSDAAVCKWENGIAEPKITYLTRLAEFFNCTLDYLVGVEDIYTSDPPNAVIKTSDGKDVTPSASTKRKLPISSVTMTVSSEDRKLIKSIQNLNPERRALLNETVNAWNNVAPSEKPDKKPT